MEIRGLTTVQKNIDPDMDVFEAFRIMQEINRLKAKLESTLKGNKSSLGVKSVVESAFKPNQMTIVGPSGKLFRKQVNVSEKVTPAYNYYLYSLELV